jgi:uncharacterized membrane protein YkgB
VSPSAHLPSIDRIDRAIAGWMERWGLRFLRISLAIVFIWFGALKPFRISPADDLIANTVYWFDPNWFIPVLGVWEVLIGVCLLIRPLIRVALLLLFLQMPGTFLPLVLLPDRCFTFVPWAPTVEGQYIIKNLVLISAAIVIGSTVRKRSTPSTSM